MDLLGIKWKLIGGAAGVALVVMTGMLVRSYVEKRSLIETNTELDRQINDPKTGFRVVLATEQANRANVEAGLERQNAALKTEAAATRVRLTTATRNLEAAQLRTLAAERQVAVLLATPPKGDTVAERVSDVDARVLEDLK